MTDTYTDLWGNEWSSEWLRDRHLSIEISNLLLNVPEHRGLTPAEMRTLDTPYGRLLRDLHARWAAEGGPDSRMLTHAEAAEIELNMLDGLRGALGTSYAVPKV